MLITNYSKSTDPITSSINFSHFAQENLEESCTIMSEEIKSQSHEIEVIKVLDVEISGYEIFDKKIFYKIKTLVNKKNVYEIMKSYDDFKILYEYLKKVAKVQNIEELPNKGNLGLFAKEVEVIEFRKFALQVYLKYLIGLNFFKDNEVFMAFLGLL